MTRGYSFAYVLCRTPSVIGVNVLGPPEGGGKHVFKGAGEASGSDMCAEPRRVVLGLGLKYNTGGATHHYSYPDSLMQCIQ